MNGETYDVVIIGGGTAGTIAAVQAGRAGARTLLVEKSGLLGGTITSADVDFPGLFHAWGRQVIAGIGWELVSRCVEECGGTLPDFSVIPERHTAQQIRIKSPIYAALCDEAMLDAGVELLLHCMVAGVERTGRDWRVALCTKAGLRDVRARVLVDCTGDANAAALAGAELRRPAQVQPASLVCRASGYDFEKLDLDAINARYAEAVAAGRLGPTDGGWNAASPNATMWLRKGGVNANHVSGINAADSEGKTHLEIEARRSLLRLYRFLRRQPGLEALQVDHLAAECGVRETVTVVGEATVTAEDYESGRLWPDALCYSFYPIDLHVPSGAGLDWRPLREGVVPTVPRGALVPKGLPDLLLAGRCISSDRVANSALRVQATCMAMGQAVGALAALAARSGVDVREVPLDDARDTLRAHGAIVPDAVPDWMTDSEGACRMDRLNENARITAEVSCGVRAGDVTLIIIEKNTKPPYGDELMPVARALAAACVDLGATPLVMDISEWMHGPDWAGGGTPAALSAAVRSADVVISAADRVGFQRMAGGLPVPLETCASGAQRWFVVQSHMMGRWGITAEQVGMIRKRSIWLNDLVHHACSISVTSPAGTDMTIDLAEGVNAFPYLWLVPLYGEVPIVPIEVSGEGILVVDGPTQWGVRPKNELDREPLRMEFGGGRVRDFRGDAEQVERLRASIAAGDPPGDCLDEIGIPTTDIEENSRYWWEDGTHAIGRIHIAIGNNPDRRGDVHGPCHMDCETNEATVTVDGVVVMQDGVFVDAHLSDPAR